jgi:putative transcriptional regulator
MSALFEEAPLAIIVTLDVMLARRKMKAKELAAFIGVTESNLSLLRTGKVRGVRFDTLARICEALKCQPGDLLVCAAASDRRQNAGE